MNNLSRTLNPNRTHRHCCNSEPIPGSFLYILILLFTLSLAFALFILIIVHNPIFLIFILLLFSLVFSILIWNLMQFRRKGAILIFLDSFPDSDLRFARDGQLVKITGSASCASVSLESSYEKVPGCIYTSTSFYEYTRFRSKMENTKCRCVRWSLAYSERFSTDFYITDKNSGTRAMVKAGFGAKVIPLIPESTLINTSSKHRVISPYLKKWLVEKNLSVEARLLRLEEGYVKEGSRVTVVGVLQRNNNVIMIVEPPEILSTGCLWKKLLFPVDIDGLILWDRQNSHSEAS